MNEDVAALGAGEIGTPLGIRLTLGASVRPSWVVPINSPFVERVGDSLVVGGIV